MKNKTFFYFQRPFDRGVIDPEEHDGAVEKSLCGHVVALESGKGHRVISWERGEIFFAIKKAFNAGYQVIDPADHENDV